eukprot:1925861-Rhodomonas_salina.1
MSPVIRNTTAEVLPHRHFAQTAAISTNNFYTVDLPGVLYGFLGLSPLFDAVAAPSSRNFLHLCSICVPGPRPSPRNLRLHTIVAEVR